MLTKWAKRALAYRLNNHVIAGLSGGSSDYKGTFEVKDTSGNTRITDPDVGSIESNKGLCTNPVSNSGICFGTGSTPATEDDYTIETPITSGLSFSSTPSRHVTFDSTTQTYTVYYDLTIANNTASDISISEMGIIVTAYKTDSIGANVNHYTGNAFRLMLERIVFDAPVTVPANEAVVLRYQVVYPPYSEE